MLRICSRQISVSIRRTHSYSEIKITKSTAASIYTSATDTAKDVPPTFLKRITNGFNTFKSSIFREREFTIDDKFKKSGVGTTWNEAIAEAEKIIQVGGGTKDIDPFKLLGRDLSDLTKNIKRLLGSGHPLLDTVSKYYFSSEGKRIRPLIVLLMSQATSIAPKQHNPAPIDYSSIIDESLSPLTSSILPTQRRLAEITEIIHTATLLHDDVIDESETRRNNPSANISFGNKMSILAGDFLLARASVALARLRNPEVIELVATVIANLVEGEFMQLKDIQTSKKTSSNTTMTPFEYYMEKTYMKTASLIAKSCCGASVLGGSTREVSEIAYNYGKNIGLAFQLIDDMLDFVVSEKELGKPVGADLKLGLATAPVLYAWEKYSELGPLIKRKFSKNGDVEKARELVYQSNGIEQTKLLAVSHCQKAIGAILKLPESDARNALIRLSDKVVTRKK
ncbi:1920_t:CDS:2 [Funneliformis geosporum]|nr:1920_t:CDS:2 [Funneliformis geosporum]